MFNLILNTVEGLAQTSVGIAKLVAAPVINLVNFEEDHVKDATRTISQGLKKVGKSND